MWMYEWIICHSSERSGSIGADLNSIRLPSGTKIVEDRLERMVVLFGGDWELNYAKEKNPDVTFLRVAPPCR